MLAGRKRLSDKHRQTERDRRTDSCFYRILSESCMLFTPFCFTCNGIIIMTSVATEVLSKYLCSEMTSSAERYIIKNQVPVQCNLTACLNFGSS